MRAHPAWSYAPYRPPFVEVGDIYICRVVPSEQGIHFEWLPCEGAVLYTVQYRLRGEGDFITAGETVGTEFDISALDFEQDYEFYVAAGSKKSRVRLARTGKSVGAVINYLHPDDEAAEEGFLPVIVRNGKAHRKSVDGGGDALHHQAPKAHRRLIPVAILVLDALDEHFAADEAQKPQGDPRDQGDEPIEKSGYGHDADPSDHGHGELEEREHACDAAHPTAFHAGLVEAVGEGHRKSVHGKADAQKQAGTEKGKAEIHDESSSSDLDLWLVAVRRSHKKRLHVQLPRSVRESRNLKQARRFSSVC